ncbi:MAG: HD-GYP domain-containing protein [Hylemonella sp.]|jgi:HD-GYP domain-containing protein (c-di-GMP phosphodiesterase class II)|uniref:HD-GYP domain-containing protein n=1 Tax=Hylemonella sp. TaxID=2066020 RepID=UPI00391BB175
MKYVPIPIAMLPVGKPLPVNVWNPEGVLLLRKGQPIVSEQHRDKLYAHNASTTESEAQAWQRSYERMVHTLLMEGVEVDEIARMPMPSAIRERDYHTGEQLNGGWLDLQEVLRGILYQGGLALNPLPRLAALENKARALLKDDPDDSLFCLFQALADSSLGYCATHALLCACICELAAQKLGLNDQQRQSIMSAALTMNIGMAREQDVLARQNHAPTPEQRQLITEHPELSLKILVWLGIEDVEELDLVRWHHQPDSPEGLPHNLQARRLLSMTDIFVAKMAARRTREALSPLESAKSIYLQTEKDVTASVGGALTAAIGFYPPGTYVRLASGETAVAVQRGLRANTPWVIAIIDRNGMPTFNYHCVDTGDPAHAIAAPILFRSGKVAINLERVRRARDKIRR